MKPIFNAAQQIMLACGLPVQNILSHRVHEHSGGQAPSATKKGPGRCHAQGDGSRTIEQRRAGAFGRRLRDDFAEKRVVAKLAAGLRVAA